MSIEVVWVKLLHAMLDVFGTFPNATDDMTSWIIERVQNLKKERDELRAQLKARNQSDIDMMDLLSDLRIKRDELCAQIAFASIPKKSSRHDKARDVAEMLYCGNTARAAELTAKIEALFQD